jgi:hypothetical protein
LEGEMLTDSGETLTTILDGTEFILEFRMVEILFHVGEGFVFE